MLQVERYGLQWTIDASDPYQIVLKQGDSLTFLGKLLIHPVWGPYIGVTRVRAFVNVNNTYEKKECWLPNPQLLKSPKNKTIDISIEEGKQYLERCITVTEPVQLSTVLNKTIVGDCFDVLPNLPHLCFRRGCYCC